MIELEDFTHELRVLYLLAKANGDAATALKLLLLIAEKEKQLEKTP